MNEQVHPKAKYARDQIYDWIVGGRLKSAERMPSERELATMLALNHRTVRRGLEYLVDEGLIEKQPRVGNFVRDFRPTKRIAVVMPDFMLGRRSGSNAHPGAYLMLTGAHRVLDQRDFLICTLGYRPHRFWTDAGVVAQSMGVQGMLVSLESDTPREDLRRLLDSGMKLVLFGSHPLQSDLGLCGVDIDTAMVMSQILNHLWELGHRRMVMAKGAGGVAWANPEEGRVLERFIQERGLGQIEDVVLDVSDEHGQDRLRSQLAGPRRPTAILAADEVIASAVFRACYQQRLRVPDDISIVARWDSAPDSHVVPLSAPESIPTAMRGVEAAADLLVRLVAGEKPPQRQISMRSDVVWRDSVAPPPAHVPS